MHAQGAGNYPHFKACRAYETALALKAEGKIRHVGISFHDRPEVLEQILTSYPQIEAVQIQFNYADYDDPTVQSRACYEVRRKYDKPVIVMEPVKGGNLVRLPEDAKAVLDALHGGSPASYALRFAAGFPGMLMVLSGMSNMEQMQDNISFMQDFRPLNEAEMAAVERVQEIFHSKHLIPLHLLPLLHRRLSAAHLHPRPVRHHEHQAALPRLERGRLLQRRPYRARPQSVRRSQMRQMRKGLSPAPAHPQAAQGCGEGI